MKSKEREVYISLSEAVNWTLCGFCRYQMGGCDCQDCKHPLVERLSDSNEGISPGCDCWGFRPAHKLNDLADIVGTYLEQGWEVCQYEFREDGMIEIQGSKNWF